MFGRHIREALANAGANQLMQPSPTRFMGLFLVLIDIQKDKTKFISVLTNQEMKEWAQKQKKSTKRRKALPQLKLNRGRKTLLTYGRGTCGGKALSRSWITFSSTMEDVETTEGEGVDFLAELLELAGWTQVNDEETEKDLS